MKTLCTFCRGGNFHCEKLLLAMKTLCCIFILNKNDPIIKLFHIVRLNVLYINLSCVAPIILFVRLFDNFMISHGILNEVFLIDIYIYIYIYIYILKIKLLLCAKTILFCIFEEKWLHYKDSNFIYFVFTFYIRRDMNSSFTPLII